MDKFIFSILNSTWVKCPWSFFPLNCLQIQCIKLISLINWFNMFEISALVVSEFKHLSRLLLNSRQEYFCERKKRNRLINFQKSFILILFSKLRRSSWLLCMDSYPVGWWFLSKCNTESVSLYLMSVTYIFFFRTTYTESKFRDLSKLRIFHFAVHWQIYFVQRQLEKNLLIIKPLCFYQEVFLTHNHAHFDEHFISAARHRAFWMDFG